MFVLTPREVAAQARRAGGWLWRRGVRAGDRVAVVAAAEPGYLPFTLGALRSGIVPVLVNVHLGAEERARILADCQPALVVETFPEDGPETDLAPWPLARPMHYTSGTTGFSKGVWSGVLSETDARALLEDERELWAAEAGDTVLVCSPLYHSAPHRMAVSALMAGARVVVFERFEAAEVARAMARERVTGAFFVPTHLRRLLRTGVSAPWAKRILHAGEPCPEPLKRAALAALPPGTLWEFYGSTEGQFTWCSPEEWLERPGTVGRARPGRQLSVDDDRLVWVTAPSFARWEYWRDPAKTSAAWRGQAFTVGDLGHLDSDGYLFLDGRREDLVVCGGVNVYPAEVERVLEMHPAVEEAAVFGVPDEEFGSRVCAAVVGSADPDDVRSWARDRLPPSHVPKVVVAVEALPRTETGKVRRTDLAALVGG